MRPTTIDLLAFFVGMALLVQQVLFAPMASMELILLALAFIGAPMVRSDASRAAVLERTPTLLLTPLDKAWLDYHHYLSSDEA